MNVPYLYNFNISKFLCFRKIQQKTLFSYLYWAKNLKFKILRQLIREKIPDDFFHDQLTPNRYYVRRSINIPSNSVQLGVVRLICVISTLARWHMLDLECLNRKMCVCVCVSTRGRGWMNVMQKEVIKYKYVYIAKASRHNWTNNNKNTTPLKQTNKSNLTLKSTLKISYAIKLVLPTSRQIRP